MGDFIMGSNTEKGKFYHQSLWEDVVFQRQDSKDRLEYIRANCFPAHKTILDLGCNVGYFSYGLLISNAGKVIGIDYDKNAIDYANYCKKYIVFKDLIEFIHAPITYDLIDKMGKVDITLALAVLSWIMKNTSREEMERIIKKISENSQVAFIELQYFGEAGGLDWLMNDADCEKYLKQFFKYVHPVCRTNTWGNRTIWKCFNDFGIFYEIFENKKSIGFLSTNCVFKKIRKKDFETFKNEIEYMKKIKDSIYFPTILKHDDKEYFASGFNAQSIEFINSYLKITLVEDLLRKELNILKNELDRYGIRHQDINRENVLCSKDGRLFLVDFEYATDLNSKEIKNNIMKTFNDVKNDFSVDKLIKENNKFLKVENG